MPDFYLSNMSERLHKAIRIRAATRGMSMTRYILEVLDDASLVEPGTPSEVVVTEPVREVEA